MIHHQDSSWGPTMSVDREGRREAQEARPFWACRHDTQDLGHTFKRKEGGDRSRETADACQEWVG